MLRRSLALLLAASFVVFRTQAADGTIYRCVLAGVTTFSDRPCGESIEVHSLEVPTPVVPASSPAASASELSPSAAKPARVPPARRANSSNHESNREAGRVGECVRLDAALRGLRARMRAGYSATEGERLRERQRATSARRRELRCR